MLGVKSIRIPVLKKSVLLLSVAIGGFIVLNIQSLTAARLEGSDLQTLPSPEAKSYVKCIEHDPHNWHPAAKRDPSGNVICVYGHEHGDPTPKWLSEHHKLGFDHAGGFMGNTSEQENTAKHAGMKGFAANIKGVDVYARIHLASNVLDRASRYHSYELYLKDLSGNISHFQGWLDTGDPILDRIPYQDSAAGEKGEDPRRRPIVWASTRQACMLDQTWCIELWAMRTWNWGPDIIWGINDATTFYKEGESVTEDISQWDKSGAMGTDRSLTVTIYREKEELEKRGVTEVPAGEIWATQFGEIVSGASDPRCSEATLKFGVSYQNICLRNYIAPTLPQITGVNNTAQKVFDSTGVELPN